MINWFGNLGDSQLRGWFLSLSRREQRLLLVAGSLLGVVMVYVVLLEPAFQYRNQYVDELSFEQSSLDWIKANEQTAQARIASAVSGSDVQLSTISRTAGTFNVPLNRVQPSANSVRVEVSDQPFRRVITWVFALQRDHGIGVEQMRLTRTDQGSIDAYIVFK